MCVCVWVCANWTGTHPSDAVKCCTNAVYIRRTLGTVITYMCIAKQKTIRQQQPQADKITTPIWWVAPHIWRRFAVINFSNFLPYNSLSPLTIISSHVRFSVAKHKFAKKTTTLTIDNRNNIRKTSMHSHGSLWPTNPTFKHHRKIVNLWNKLCAEYDEDDVGVYLPLGQERERERGRPKPWPQRRWWWWWQR